MSVLIKGMMMPENCQTCPFVQNEYPIGGEALAYRCRCTFTQKITENALERNKDCPLVDATEEYMKHYRQGLHDQKMISNGELMQIISPD